MDEEAGEGRASGWFIVFVKSRLALGASTGAVLFALMLLELVLVLGAIVAVGCPRIEAAIAEAIALSTFISL